MSDGPPLLLSKRNNDAHKGAFGKVLLVGGSRGMSGAIALSAMGAIHTGSGLVTAAVPDRCLETVASFHPGVMTIPLADDSDGRFGLDAASDLSALIKNYDAIGVGPGMTTAAGSTRVTGRLVEANLPRVIDADAINCLAEVGFTDNLSLSNAVLTPHPGEFQRITGVPANNRAAQLDAAATIANQTGAVIVLKGGPSVVVGPQDTTDGQVAWTNTTGNPGMATAGSGDVLTGIVTSLMGQGLSCWNAAKLGVWIHGAAGDIAADRTGQAGMTCREILAALPKATAAATKSVD